MNSKIKAILITSVIVLCFIGIAICGALEKYHKEKMHNRALAAEIELFRLKTAMALVGIDDFIETTPGNVEVKMIK